MDVAYEIFVFSDMLVAGRGGYNMIVWRVTVRSKTQMGYIELAQWRMKLYAME